MVSWIGIYTRLSLISSRSSFTEKMSLQNLDHVMHDVGNITGLEEEEEEEERPPSSKCDRCP